ncbi:hypothetical protein TrLO_g8153 [Triparma laevis f. longispina]|uniref:K Homology domain-containing protein n=1 Tax=Triparma laevis f. longispina TaxID=1714387 RepID=A0A9W7C9A3_9STRA|nr:hypothetical protein TrLO_g8153 [Triparma laevis f. longispina]
MQRPHSDHPNSTSTVPHNQEQNNSAHKNKGRPSQQRGKKNEVRRSTQNKQTNGTGASPQQNCQHGGNQNGQVDDWEKGVVSDWDNSFRADESTLALTDIIAGTSIADILNPNETNKTFTPPGLGLPLSSEQLQILSRQQLETTLRVSSTVDLVSSTVNINPNPVTSISSFLEPPQVEPIMQPKLVPVTSLSNSNSLSLSSPPRLPNSLGSPNWPIAPPPPSPLPPSSSLPKSAPVPAESLEILTSKIDALKITEIIGPGGGGVRKIKDDSGVHYISFDKKPVQGYTCVKVMGLTMDLCEKAIELIHKRASQIYILKGEISSSVATEVIGRGALGLKAIRNSSSVRSIDVSKKDRLYNGAFIKDVTIVGPSMVACKIAMNLVYQRALGDDGNGNPLSSKAETPPQHTVQRAPVILARGPHQPRQQIAYGNNGMIPYMLKDKIDSSQTSSVLGRNGEGVVAIKQLSGATSIYFTQLPVDFLPGIGVKSECEVKITGPTYNVCKKALELVHFKAGGGGTRREPLKGFQSIVADYQNATKYDPRGGRLGYLKPEKRKQQQILQKELERKQRQQQHHMAHSPQPHQYSQPYNNPPVPPERQMAAPGDLSGFDYPEAKTGGRQAANLPSGVTTASKRDIEWYEENKKGDNEPWQFDKPSIYHQVKGQQMVLKDMVNALKVIGIIGKGGKGTKAIQKESGVSEICFQKKQIQGEVEVKVTGPDLPTCQKAIFLIHKRARQIHIERHVFDDAQVTVVIGNGGKGVREIQKQTGVYWFDLHTKESTENRNKGAINVNIVGPSQESCLQAIELIKERASKLSIVTDVIVASRVAEILGQGKNGVQAIKDETGVLSINFARHEDDNELGHQEVSVKGPNLEGVLKALDLIKNFDYQRRHTHTPQASMTNHQPTVDHTRLVMLKEAIDADKVKVVIGRAATGLKAIKDQSGVASIFFENFIFEGKQECTIRGPTMESCQRAFELIYERIFK